MRYSVIIPTHDQTYLRAAVDSVLAQTEQDFEIVVAPNGKNGAASTIMGIDPRLRVAWCDAALLGKIGRAHV